MNAIIFPNIDPIALAFGPVEIRWYGIAYVIGIVLGWLYARHLVTRHPGKMKPSDIDDFVVWAAIGVILGGRLGYILFYKPLELLSHPWELLYIWEPGRSFHGGLLGVAFAAGWFCFKRRMLVLPLADIAAAASTIGLFFGRIANFINAELYGRTTELPWGVVFPGGGPEPRHPSQIYEALTEGLLLFIILFVIERWTDLRNTRPGLQFSIFLIGYGVARVFSEFFRQPDAHLGFFYGGTTMGQLLSTPILLAGAILIWHVLSQRKMSSR